MTEKNKEDFENSTKCCIFNNDYVDGDVKVRDDFHITGKVLLKEKVLLIETVISMLK